MMDSKLRDVVICIIPIYKSNYKVTISDLIRSLNDDYNNDVRNQLFNCIDFFIKNNIDYIQAGLNDDLKPEVIISQLKSKGI